MADVPLNPNDSKISPTFQFDPATGEIISKPINPNQYEENFFNHLIEHAENIKNFPDCYMFYKVDESDYF